MSDDLGDGVRGREPGENPNALQLFYIFLFPLKIEKYVYLELPKFGWFNPYELNKSNNSSGVLSMWACKLTLDEEKSKHASLDQQNGFWHSSCAQFAEVGKRRSQGYNTCLLLIG